MWARLNGWRPGIAWQLGIAFLGVAVLAGVANFAVQRTISITTTRIVPAEAANRDVPVPRRSAPPQAAPPQAAPARVVRDGRPALPALERLAEVAQEDSGVPASQRLQSMQAAASEVRAALARTRGSGERIDGARRSAEQLIEIDVARGQAHEEYVAMMARLDGRFREAMERHWNPRNQVVTTPRALMQAERLFQQLRRQGEVLRDDDHGLAQIDLLVAFEDQFGGVLADEQRELVRAFDGPWHAQSVADFELLRALRQRIVQLDTQRREILPLFHAELEFVRAQLQRPAIVEVVRPARKAPANAGQPPVLPPLFAVPAWELGTFHRREQAVDEGIAPTGLAWLSGGVLALLLLVSVLTVRSILRPVRRLIAATQRIAHGETGVRVAHDGGSELDRLAGAFNRMAAELESAQAVARNYQQRLEARVAERTRQLQHQADHDSLTQLPNRRQLFERLRAALARASAGQGQAGLFFIDLDHFKTINDGRGHGFGDRVLVAVGERLAGLVGSRGVAARFGGDEFIVLLEAGAGEEQLLREAGRLLVQAFNQPLQPDGRDLLVSVSVGAAFYPQHASDPESLLSAADAALFRAKALGRSQLAVFTAELLEAAATRFTTEQGLRHAVERSELELAFQPEVDIGTLEVTVCEALLRWRRPDGRLVGPDHFLLVAEESGLIVEINDWVLRTAIAAVAGWRRNGHQHLRVAVNASSRQLADPAFAGRVAGLLVEHGVPPAALEIELTESVLQTGSGTIEGLRRLHEIGVTVALDDFGTGYSSLASLEQLPLTRVKLDRSLIAGIDTGARSAAIANAIIQLCCDLDLQVTAEGVERAAQLAALRDSGVTLQGFLLARPMSDPQLEEVVQQLPQKLQSLLLSVAPAGSRHSGGADIVRLDPGSTRRRRRLSGAPRV